MNKYQTKEAMIQNLEATIAGIEDGAIVGYALVEIHRDQTSCEDIGYTIIEERRGVPMFAMLITGLASLQHWLLQDAL